MSAHLVDASGRLLCPEALVRDRMNDAEFWEHVFYPHGNPEPEFSDFDDLAPVADLQPCPECGERGPCAYDPEGRPMVHLIEVSDD